VEKATAGEVGKGSKRRPLQVDENDMEANWHHVFKRENKNQEKNRYKRGKKNESK